MSKEKSTITAGMGLPNDFCESSQDLIIKSMKATNYLSDGLIEIAKSVREECLGECDIELSEYERKLILVGFIAGEMRGGMSMMDMMGKFLEGLSEEDEE